MLLNYADFDYLRSQDILPRTVVVIRQRQVLRRRQTEPMYFYCQMFLFLKFFFILSLSDTHTHAPDSWTYFKDVAIPNTRHHQHIIVFLNNNFLLDNSFRHFFVLIVFFFS